MDTCKGKRKLSLLNTDFKTLTGVETSRHNDIIDHTVSANQFAVGKNKKIHQAIALARDAIFASSKIKSGCGITDLDFEAAFNSLCMEWVKAVLRKKGLHPEAVSRIKRIYSDGVTIPVVNSKHGEDIKNSSRSLRQGDCPSSLWFSYGVNPLLIFLKEDSKAS